MNKGGGVGMLIKQGTDWQRVHESCKEHLWVRGTIEGKNTWLGVVYLWTGSSAREENEEMVNCLRRDINEFKDSGEIIIVGDMNAHIEGLDGYTDHNGSLVMDLFQENWLVIVNTESKCDEQIAWGSGNRQSSIDYIFIYLLSYSQGPEALQRGVVIVTNKFIDNIFKVSGVGDSSDGGREMVPVIRCSW